MHDIILLRKKVERYHVLGPTIHHVYRQHDTTSCRCVAQAKCAWSLSRLRFSLVISRSQCPVSRCACMAEAGDTNIKQSVEGEGNTSNLPSEGAALGAPAQASAVQETEGAALGAPKELDPEVAKTAERGSSPSGLPLEELPVATEEPALSESQPTISVDGREAAEGAPDPPDEDFEDVVEETPPTETKEEVFEDLPEEVEELEGCTSALAEEKTEVEPVEALDHVMATVQGNTQSAPGSEEDTSTVCPHS